jgi:hypothetical protein
MENNAFNFSFVVYTLPINNSLFIFVLILLFIILLVFLFFLLLSKLYSKENPLLFNALYAFIALSIFV